MGLISHGPANQLFFTVTEVCVVRARDESFGRALQNIRLHFLFLSPPSAPPRLHPPLLRAWRPVQQLPPPSVQPAALSVSSSLRSGVAGAASSSSCLPSPCLPAFHLHACSSQSPPSSSPRLCHFPLLLSPPPPLLASPSTVGRRRPPRTSSSCLLSSSPAPWLRSE